MSEHISEVDLLLALDGELPLDRNEAVMAHIHDCPACTERSATLSHLSDAVAVMERPNLTFRPQEAAVAALVSHMKSAPRKAHWTTRSLVFANSLVAVAVAITCIALFPSLRVGTHAAARPAAVYDLEDSVPAGYTSLPFADPALPLDDSAVLPVELSEEDLELMGVDVNDTDNPAPRGNVQAEILIGMDGWPRAIRIVE